MSNQTTNCSKLTEAVKLLAVTAQSLKAAKQVFHNFDLFAAANWDQGCYACFDWVALSRRMFRRTFEGLDELRRSYWQDFDDMGGAREGIEWCHEQIANVMDRGWFERSFGPQDISLAAQQVFQKVEAVLALVLDWEERHDSREKAGGGRLRNIPAVATALAMPPNADKVLVDPAASFWLKHALRSALERDPVDAASDAGILLQVLKDRCEEALSWPARIAPIELSAPTEAQKIAGSR